MSAAAAKTRSNNRFCKISKRDSGRRVSCRARDRPERGEFDLVELVQDLLGAEMDSTGSVRKVSAQRSMVAVADHGSSTKIASGARLRTLAAASARSRSSMARRISGGCGGNDRREKAAADDIDAKRPRLVAVDKGADMCAGADQEDALRGKQARGTRQRGDADDGVTQHDQARRAWRHKTGRSSRANTRH